jgi:hypothetical protein
MTLQPPLFDPGLYTVRRTPWTAVSPPYRRVQNKRPQTFMPRVGFEPTTPVFGLARTVHASDRAVSVLEWQDKLVTYVFSK